MLPRKPLVLTLDTSGGMLSSWTELGSLRLPRTPRTDDVPATIDQKLYWNEVRIVSSCCVSGSDADSQPEGAFTAHLSGFEQALDSLVAAGWVKMGAGSIAKLALGISAHPGPDGRPTVDAPVTIQNRHISLGPAKLGQLPELKLD